MYEYLDCGPIIIACLNTVQIEAMILLQESKSTEYRVQSTEYRVQSTEYRVQSTEYRVQSTVYTQ